MLTSSPARFLHASGIPALLVSLCAVSCTMPPQGQSTTLTSNAPGSQGGQSAILTSGSPRSESDSQQTRARSVRLEAAFAFGDAALDVDGGTSSEAIATLFRIELESLGPVTGARLRLYRVQSKDELATLNGLGQSVTAQSVDNLGLFAHFTDLTRFGDHLPIPLRVGPILDRTREVGVIGAASRSEVEYLMFGVQLQNHPHPFP